MEKPSYYSVITADVRYDKRLSANEKLIYGEITSLCSSTGECWANNAYFAELYDRRKETISLWIRNLVKWGHIKSVLTYKEGTKEVEKRVITLTRLIHTPPSEKSSDPLAINRKDNNTSINNTSIIGKCVSTPAKTKPIKAFSPPEQEEVRRWAASWANDKKKNQQKVVATALEAWAWYGRSDWRDRDGKQIKSWKRKIATVWFTDDKIGAAQIVPKSYL